MTGAYNKKRGRKAAASPPLFFPMNHAINSVRHSDRREESDVLFLTV